MISYDYSGHPASELSIIWFRILTIRLLLFMHLSIPLYNIPEYVPYVQLVYNNYIYGEIL